MSQAFLEKLYTFYNDNKRDFEWRNTTDPYKILVSEMMLQQTQTGRVISKYNEFLRVFPTISSLANASQPEVLKQWQGLGYNRRALYLKRVAEEIVRKGDFPNTFDELVKLPGIGKNTAGAILAFAFNIPEVFIETNIRRVYIHEFFNNRIDVHDKEVLVLIAKTLDRKNPRKFYYALMDYGAYLGKNMVNPNRRSKHYKRQSTFSGSIRQTRGEILKRLLTGEDTMKTLKQSIASSHFEAAINQLIAEGFIERKDKRLILKS